MVRTKIVRVQRVTSDEQYIVHCNENSYVKSVGRYRLEIRSVGGPASYVICATAEHKIKKKKKGRKDLSKGV
jgi:hypothetical protein